MNNISSVNNGVIDPELLAKEAMANAGVGMDDESLESVQKAVGEMLLAGLGLASIVKASVTNEAAAGAQEAPELDEPEETEQVSAEIIAKLVALLKLETDELQASEARKRINSLKSEIQQRTTERLKKIDESLKEMDKAASSSLFMKVFGWVATAIAAIAAVAACVVTGGVALGPVVGAVLAIGFQTLNETGVTEQITEKLSDALEKAGCSELAAKVLASVIVALVQIAASIGGGCAANSAAKSLSTTFNAIKTMTAVTDAVENISEGAMEMVKAISAGVAGGMALIGVEGQTIASADSYSLGMTNAELTKFEALIQTLRQRLEEYEKDLEEIVDQLASGPETIFNLLQSTLESQSAIANNLGRMA